MRTADEVISFSLLGSLRVTRGGTGLALGARQQRLVLALLLARAGTPVTMTELIDLLWDRESPASAANVVHRHVGELRRLLEPGLPTRSPGRYLPRELTGYRLVADEQSLDLLKFRSLSKLAAHHRQDGEPELALRHGLDGLRLWRGRCAAGLEPASRLHPAFLAVEAERAQAVREAADAAESCGRLGAVLIPLRQAAEQHPLDESLQSRLLLALAADGRQAEAVEMFRVVRRRLADELGIDPGAELREAYDRLLHQRTRPGPAATLPRPAQLPPDLPFFSGRGDLLAEARRAVAGSGPGGPAVLAIDGMPGVGKTALAVRLAHEFAGDYPDGQLYVDLRGFDAHEPAMSPAEALRGFLGSLGVPQAGIPAELHAQAGLYRSSVAGRRLLIVLDNCRDAEQIRHLLPGSPGCLVIVTSRSRLSGLLTTAGAHPLPVGLPSVAEAREALTRRLGAGRVAAAPAAVGALIESCGRLPLALAVVGARAAGLPQTPLEQIAAELEQVPGSLDGFDGDDPQTDLRAVFSWSYQALSPPAARLFRLLPIHPGPDVSIAGAAGLAGVSPRAGRTLIGELSRANLISEDQPGRYRTHDLLRAYATELGEECDTAAERAQAEQRCLEFYRATGYHAHRRLLAYAEYHPMIEPGPGETPLQFDDLGAAMRWFTAERAVLIALIGRAARQGHHGVAWQLALGMQHFFERSGRWADWTATGEVALAAARQGGDLVGQARMHRSLAGAAYFRHDFDAAVGHLDEARELLARLGLTGELTRAGVNRAMILRAQGRHEEVVRALAETLAPARAAGDDKLLGDALVVMAASSIELGRHEEAARWADQAMALFRGSQDPLGVGEAWEVLGRVHGARHEPAGAIGCWRAAAQAYREASAAAPAAEVLALVGDTLAADGDPAGAEQAWRQALELIPYAQTPTGRRLAERLTAVTSRS